MIKCRLALVGLLRGFIGSAILAMILVTAAYAGRPAAELLPENTLGMISISDTRDLAARFMNTDLGRMTQDPQMKPFVIQLYSSLSDLVATFQDRIGLSLAEIVALPQGEVTFAVVPVKDAPPAYVLMMDAGDQINNARTLLQRGVEEAVKSGATKQEETVKDTKITIVSEPDQQRFACFDKDGAVVASTNPDVIKDILAAWNGEKTRFLSDNNNFKTIMSRCRGDKDERPQIIWFVDPINIMRSIAEQNAAVRVGVAMLPMLGLDGLSAIGGGMLFDAGQYNSVSHIHVLLENPRSGIIKMIALEPGVSKPERWVPPDVASYTTLHCKFDTTLKTLKPMYDSLAGEGALSKWIEQRFSTPAGIDIEKEILPALEGRVTYITWFEKPITLVSGITLVAIKFKDTEALGKAVENFVSQNQERISQQSSAGKNYYRVMIPVPQNRPNPPPVPIPCFGIVDDYLVIASRPSLYERVLGTLAEGTKSLADELDFKLVASKIQRQSGGAKPVILGFNRSEEDMRYYYDLANAERTKEALKRQAERNPFFKSLDTALQNNPLPPFEVIQRYLAPGGEMATDDDSGLHFMSFSLRRKGE